MNQGDLPSRNSARDALLLEQVLTYVRAGDLTRATTFACKALDDGYVHPMLLNLRAGWLEAQGRENEALADLQRAIAIAPDDGAVRTSHGILLTRLKRRDEAIAALQAAIALTPDFAPAHFNFGWALESLGELEASRAHYERAASLDPHYADPLAHLAALAYGRGDWSEAHAFADSALAINNRHYLALITHACAANAEKDYERAEANLAKLEKLNKREIPPIDQAFVSKTFGNLRHAQGRYAEAFTAYADANVKQLKIFAPRLERPGAENGYSYALWLKEYFEKAPTEQWAARPTASPSGDKPSGAAGHVFLGSTPRSGTTLLASILGSHHDVALQDENDLLGDALRAFMANSAGRERLATVSGPEISRHRAIYWQNARRFGGDVKDKIFVNKQPFFYDKLPLVAKLFPDTKVLFVFRDPRDVLLSCFRNTFPMNPATFQLLTLERAARFYDIMMQLNTIYREKLALDWLDVRYEALTVNFDTEMRKVCDFLGLAWDESMRDFSQLAKAQSLVQPSAIQVMRGLNRESVGQWRHYAEELAPILPVLEPWVEKFGYPPD